MLPRYSPSDFATAVWTAIINGIEEMPQQTMASMVYQNKEVLFPINDQFVKSIDQAAKKILVELPDGLLAIYLS